MLYPLSYEGGTEKATGAVRCGLRSGRLDELEVQLDLDDVSEQGVESSEVDPKVLAA